MLRTGTPSDSGTPSLTGEAWSCRRPPCQCLGLALGWFPSLFHIPLLSPGVGGGLTPLFLGTGHLSVSTGGPHLRLWAAARVRTDGRVLRPHRKLSPVAPVAFGEKPSSSAAAASPRDGAPRVQGGAALSQAGRQRRFLELVSADWAGSSRLCEAPRPRLA